MSPHNRSIPNFTIHYQHILVALTVALALLFVQMPTAFAADDGQGDDGREMTMVAQDKLCVDGLVISHRHHAVSGAQITATYVDDPGAHGPLTATSDENGEFKFDLPVPGNWSFSLNLSPGWQAVTPVTLNVNVTYGLTECVKIRFKVQQVVTVEVLKINDKHVPQQGWLILATPGPHNLYGQEQRDRTNANGIAVFELTPGEWIFSESAPDGVTAWHPISPPTGSQHLVVAVPGPYNIRFKNYIKEKKLKACIEVIKKDATPDENGITYGLPNWPIEVLDEDGKVVAHGYTDAEGKVKFSDLPEGAYTVREILLPGWEAVSPMIIDVEIFYNGGACKELVFTNRQVEKGLCLEGYKLDGFGSYGIPGWEIDATPVDGGYDPEPVLTDGQGHYQIDLPMDYKEMPGSTYEVCETVQDGWESVGDECHTVTVPKHAYACVPVPDFVNRQIKADPPEYEKPKHMKPEPKKPEPKKPEPKKPGYKKSGYQRPGYR